MFRVCEQLKSIEIFSMSLTLQDTLKERKSLILKTLQEADDKFQVAKDNLNSAKLSFETSASKAEEIRSQSLVNANQTSKTYLEQIEEEIQRLNESKFVTIKLEEEKIITEVVRHDCT